MPKQRSPDRNKAFEIYKNKGGNITNREIATILNVSEKTIGAWKYKDKWEDNLNGVLRKNEWSTPKKESLKGNKNAIGNSGGSAPKGNKNAEKYGFFSKYLPQESLEIIQDMETKSLLDLLWDNIVIQYTAIIRAQRIMHVKNKEDLVKEIRKEKSGEDFSETELEIQFSWDRQAKFLQAQSRAISELRSCIKSYLELEGANNEKAKSNVIDWKQAVEEIAKRREKQNV